MRICWNARSAIGGMAMAASLLVGPSLAHAGDESYRITVTGGTDAKAGAYRLNLFHTLLVLEVAPRTLSEAFIECAECEELVEGKPVKALTFYVRRAQFDRKLPLFTAIWRETHGEKPASDFVLSIDAVPPPLLHADPSCNLPYCAIRTACAGSGGCSETQFPNPCRKCDGVSGLDEGSGSCATAERKPAAKGN